MISISQLGEIFEKMFPSLGKPENSARDIYTLLDIDQKGLVKEEDISSFLKQLEEAEVDCVEDLSHKLWKYLLFNLDCSI